MNTQPESLRLAAWLETKIPPTDTTTFADVATELRRLHEVNLDLLEALSEVVDMCDELQFKYLFVEEAKAALAKAKGEVK